MVGQENGVMPSLPQNLSSVSFFFFLKASRMLSLFTSRTSLLSHLTSEIYIIDLDVGSLHFENIYSIQPQIGKTDHVNLFHLVHSTVYS